MPSKKTKEVNINQPGTIKNTLKLIVLLALLIGISFLLSFPFNRENLFVKKAKECNGSPINHRFSCYRAAIEEYYGSNPLAFVKLMQKKQDQLSFEATFTESGKVSYAIFGTNCHSFYHAAGDFVATHFPEKELKELSTYGRHSCTDGFTMGLYKRRAVDKGFTEDLLKSYWKLCPKGSTNQCAHEVGHLLHDKYFLSVMKTVDKISADVYGLKYPKEYRYITIQKTDFNAPFAACRKIIPEKKVAQCYTGIGHNLFLFSEFSKDGYKSLFDQCNAVQGEDREYCYEFFIYRIGINEGAVRFINQDFEEGNKPCHEVVDLSLSKNPDFDRDELLLHCYRGIGGGIGLFADSEYTEAKIAQQDPKFAEDILFFGRLCDHSVESQKDNCYTGLLGTRYNKLYQIFKVYIDRIEKILPTIDSDFEIVG